MTTQPIRAVIFDLDGTLLDTLRDLSDSMNAVTKAHGYGIHTIDEIRFFVGNGAPKLVERAIPGGRSNPDYDACLSDFKAYYSAHLTDTTAPYPGIPEALRLLRRRGIRVGVVSNKLDSAVKPLCRRYFPDTVEVAIGESPAVRKKPAPDSVLTAMRLLGVTREETVYVGDSDVDIETAKNVGIPCLSVLWGFRDKDFLLAHGADTFVSDASQLPAILGL